MIIPGNILFERRRISLFKIKIILPEAKVVSVKKNGQKIRDMTVRLKAIYFSGKNRRFFLDVSRVCKKNVNHEFEY